MKLVGAVIKNAGLLDFSLPGMSRLCAIWPSLRATKLRGNPLSLRQDCSEDKPLAMTGCIDGWLALSVWAESV